MTGKMHRVAVDWDGTCVDDYTWPEMGDWLPGAVTALKYLAGEFDEVVIFTCRVAPVDTDESTPHDPTYQIDTIAGMIDAVDLPENVVVWTKPYKPPADHYIDNKAVRFEGSWKDVLEAVKPSNLPRDYAPPYYYNSGVWSYQTASGGNDAVRIFDTGASRDTDDGKLDYEGFFSPAVLQRRAQYMHEHRKLPDGSYRDSDNWQKGIPGDAYMKSMWRHFMDVWLIHRDADVTGGLEELESALCALAFNVDGMLFELLKGRYT